MSARLEYLRTEKLMCHPLPETLDEAVLQRISDGPHLPESVVESTEGITNSSGAPAGSDWQALRGNDLVAEGLRVDSPS